MKEFRGVLTALITPFLNGKIDYLSLERLIEFQLENQIDGFVINGTTAESPTISEAEMSEIFQFVQARVPKKLPLILGTGTNSTEGTIRNCQTAERLGADACLVVVPYYNKPPQRGLLEHFKKIASSVQTPIFLYNVPGRTITSLEVETIKKLSEHPQIVGIKEASGDIEFAKKIRQVCGRHFHLLSGDDGTYDQFMTAGGEGIISVASHILPVEMKAQKISEIRDLIDFLFCEANPIPVKMALYLMKIIKSPELRLPLVTLSEDRTEKLRSLMRKNGLLK